MSVPHPLAGRRLAAAAALALAATVTAGVASAAGVAPRTDHALEKVVWGPCPKYTAEETRQLPNADWPGFADELARMECGRLQAPLDWARPGGRKVTLALNRLRATDQARRIGALAINPGGPGASGWFMPIGLAVKKAVRPLAAWGQVRARYDLVGFDPRGVGYSTRLDCPKPKAPAYDPKRTQEQNAHRARQANADWLARCAASDPALARSLTTETIARDLDAMRAALGEERLNYLGISWGTRLGAMYRSMFPKRVGRFVLDSSMWPDFRLDRIGESTTRATEAQAKRFAAWLARYDRQYRFGATSAKVLTEMARIQRTLSEHPARDRNGRYVTGRDVAGLLGAPSGGWSFWASILGDFRKLAAGTPGPALDQRVLDVLRAPVAFAAPEAHNEALYSAVVCNEDTSTREFAGYRRWWRQNADRYPLTGQGWDDYPICAGWPYPAKAYAPTKAAGPLQLVVHTLETVTPAEASGQLRQRIGGTLLRLVNDEHGGLLNNSCGADKAVVFLTTGRPQTGSCPAGPEPKPAPGAARRTAPLPSELPNPRTRW